MSETSFVLQSQHKFYLNTTPGVEPGNFVILGGGLNNFEHNPNEEIAEDNYLDDEGFGSTDVTGLRPAITFSGHRKIGDPAQDFIFSKQYKIGNERKTQFRWEMPDGTTIEGNCVITNIEGPSGDSNAKGEISFEIRFEGIPTVTTPTP